MRRAPVAAVQVPLLIVDVDDVTAPVKLLLNIGVVSPFSGAECCKSVLHWYKVGVGQSGWFKEYCVASSPTESVIRPAPSMIIPFNMVPP